MMRDFFLTGKNKYSEWIKKYHRQDIFPVKFDKNLSIERTPFGPGQIEL